MHVFSGMNLFSFYEQKVLQANHNEPNENMDGINGFD